MSSPGKPSASDSSYRSSSIGSRPTTTSRAPHSSHETLSPCSVSASTKTSSLHSGQIDVGISYLSPGSDQVVYRAAIGKIGMNQSNLIRNDLARLMVVNLAGL